ncbi:hypothetical protein L6452_37459 [Arctium lappa]|uniref:Uncharacterized protein n=1 Tax=Arctium lappa TaxID=4217 RepID=A0ACB8Y343_ARCLA|nr:hypothetical protein L6452_37459 [Arctium lappa]
MVEAPDLQFQNMKQVFTSCPDLLRKKQFYHILARQVSFIPCVWGCGAEEESFIRIDMEWRIVLTIMELGHVDMLASADIITLLIVVARANTPHIIYLYNESSPNKPTTPELRNLKIISSISAMEDIFETLVQHNCSWLKGRFTFYKYQGFWNSKDLLEGTILAQQNFKAQPSDVLLSSCPKTGTTWLKALAFAIVTRAKFDDSTSPLLTTLAHECIPFLEKYDEETQVIQKNSGSPLVATHLPYASLPESLIASNCKIVYIYRNAKDVVVSYYHYLREIQKLSMEDAPFEEAFEDFCQGNSLYGPYWDHILGYWKASMERPGRILLLKYEDLKRDTRNEVKRLAEFIGYPFSVEEEKAGVVENIVKLCSFENLSSLEVNKSGRVRAEGQGATENRFFFRKAKDGDWENYFTDEMKDKLDKLMDQKMSGTGLILK